MLIKIATTPSQIAWCQEQITREHYLHAPVDVRSRPLVYMVYIGGAGIGCLIYNRTESTRCYQGSLTYGSMADVQAGRACYSRWEILSLARVWLSPSVQAGGEWHTPALLPGYMDRRGQWRSTLASSAIRASLARVGYDYLRVYPPVWLHEPYQIRVVSSYCDTRYHKGTIYHASGFERVRVNERGIETWATRVSTLGEVQESEIIKLAQQSARSRELRSRADVVQREMELCTT